MGMIDDAQAELEGAWASAVSAQSQVEQAVGQAKVKAEKKLAGLKAKAVQLEAQLDKVKEEGIVDYAKDATKDLRSDLADQFSEMKGETLEKGEEWLDKLAEMTGLDSLMGAVGGGTEGVKSEIKEMTISHQCYLLARAQELATLKKTHLEIQNPKKLPYWHPGKPNPNHLNWWCRKRGTPPKPLTKNDKKKLAKAQETVRKLTAQEKTEGNEYKSAASVVSEFGPRPECPAPFYASNACLMADCDPFTFMNRLTQNPNQATFFNMSPAQVSSLVPRIRLYKVTFDDKGGETQREINFSSYATSDDVKDIFSNKLRRGFGVGLKDFEFTYDGNNPFAAKKSIKAELTIFANSLDELFKERGGYKYVDLALKTGGPAEDATPPPAPPVNSNNVTKKAYREHIKNLQELRFRIKAVVGWADPRAVGAPSHIDTDLMNAISESYVTLNLTPTTHDFKLDEMGRVTFTISYLAYVDEFYGDAKFNVFSDPGVELERTIRRLSKKKAQTECDSTTPSDEENKRIQGENQKSLASLFKRLQDRGRLKWLSASTSDIKKLKSEGPAMKFAGGAMKRNQILDSAPNDGPGVVPISFVFVSDLLDTILENLEVTLSTMPTLLAKSAGLKQHVEQHLVDPDDVAREIGDYVKFYKQFTRFRVLLGPMEMRSARDDAINKFSLINMGDLPIATQYLNEWLAANFLKTSRTIYPLSTFLTDLFNQLVRNFLNGADCFGEATGDLRTRLNQAVITSYDTKDGNDKHDRITKLLARPSAWGPQRPYRDGVWASRLPLAMAPNTPLLRIAGPIDLPIASGGAEQEIHYLTFFVGRSAPAEQMQGIKKSYKDKAGVIVPGDEARGIFHYAIGQRAGIVKKIKLAKTESKYLKEVRFEQEGYAGLEQLREVYDVEIDTFPNVRTYPGTYIYVDPRGFAPDSGVADGSIDLTQFGVGGYCMIIRSTTRLGPGVANTHLTAKWVASKEAKNIADVPPTQAETKCEEAAQLRKGASFSMDWSGIGDSLKGQLLSLWDDTTEFASEKLDSVSSWAEKEWEQIDLNPLD